jgi:hypothetical protein
MRQLNVWKVGDERRTSTGAASPVTLQQTYAFAIDAPVLIIAGRDDAQRQVVAQAEIDVRLARHVVEQVGDRHVPEVAFVSGGEDELRSREGSDARIVCPSGDSRKR